MLGSLNLQIPIPVSALHFNTSLPSLYKIQFDAAVRSNYFVAAAVCLDINNEVLAACTKYLSAVSDPLMCRGPGSSTCGGSLQVYGT